MKPCVYIAGPMRGYPEHNYPAFNAAAARFRALGYDVVNPVEVNHTDDPDGTAHPPEWYVANDLRAMLGGDLSCPCTGIALLPGWERSVGARCEVALAITLGFQFFDAVTTDPRPHPYAVTIAGGYSAPKGAAGDSLDILAQDIRAWQRDTFPLATPSSCAEHLRREAIELAQAPTDEGEVADVFHLLVAVACASGMDLAAVVRRKFLVNLSREWGQPDAQGVVEHVSSAERCAECGDEPVVWEGFCRQCAVDIPAEHVP